MSITVAIKGWFTRETSNEQLMLRYTKLRQRQVLAQLYENCGDDLYHFLLTLSDPELASDIAQQAWIKVIEKSHLYRPDGQFKSWLFTIGRRLLIDELRRQARYQYDEFDEQHHASPVFDNDDRLVRFNQILDDLPFHQREAFCLQQEGFSLAEISSICAAEQETIKSRLRYAKRKLNKALRTSQASEDFRYD
ncbi:sigma-70 family RNA polymerase sigma factor [Alteromonas sp. ASW11-36]|uniref:Sigma-70 family RNA polymerase sigma factor n=1 Tax=Alteromonas arenosi TaxID=3055817 RepID=A0ABT7T160_9ALTE|nr:sigma-70 family RNA polymerase sigma factor [Alteromonas sp. ASW11-36]MDM7861527.1 sigma-70 family RNA polymerase sigma factor [Alteromonas sp. ASW11-36]